MIQEMYGLDIAEITLRRWTKRLKDEDIISQSEGRQSSEWWITYRVDGEKHQEPVEEADLPAVHNYWKRHAEVLKEMLIRHNGNRSAAWNNTIKQMWLEYGCCYYRCKCLQINGISTEEIDTIIDLVDEILELDRFSSNVEQT